MKSAKSIVAVIVIGVSSTGAVAPHAAADEVQAVRHPPGIELPDLEDYDDSACLTAFAKALIEGATFCAPMP